MGTSSLLALVIGCADGVADAASLACSGDDWVTNHGDAPPATNMTADARFVDAEGGDFNLLTGFSPCIDAGNPLSGHNDVDGSRNDMGVFGGLSGSW